MKNKFLLFITVFVVGMLSANFCWAHDDNYNDNYGRGNYYGNGNHDVNEECSGSFWDDDCQQAIKERDYNSNRRQIPRRYYYEYDYDSDYDYDYYNRYSQSNQDYDHNDNYSQPNQDYYKNKKNGGNKNH